MHTPKQTFVGIDVNYDKNYYCFRMLIPIGFENEWYFRTSYLNERISSIEISIFRDSITFSTVYFIFQVFNLSQYACVFVVYLLVCSSKRHFNPKIITMSYRKYTPWPCEIKVDVINAKSFRILAIFLQES